MPVGVVLTLAAVSAPVIAAIRRYPVKAMAGEWLNEVRLDGRGLKLDRWFAVVDADGRFAAGKNSRRFRRRDAVFDYAAAVRGVDVVVRRAPAAADPADRAEQMARNRRDPAVDGPAPATWTVGDPALDAELSAAMDAPVRVLPEIDASHQDAGAVSLVGTASLQWLRTQLDVDAHPRRIRANLVVDTAEPFEEEAWPGREITVGGATLQVVERIERCRVVDLAQDGVTTRTTLLKTLGEHRDLCLGVYADVVRQGLVAIGDPIGCTGRRPNRPGRTRPVRGQPTSTSSNGRRGVAGTGEPYPIRRIVCGTSEPPTRTCNRVAVSGTSSGWDTNDAASPCAVATNRSRCIAWPATSSANRPA